MDFLKTLFGPKKGQELNTDAKEIERAKKGAKKTEQWVAVLKRREENRPDLWVEKWKTAAQALGEIGDYSATEPIVEAALEDFYNRQRTNANRHVMIEALRKIGDPSAIDLLVAKLKHGERSSIHSAAAEVLGRLGDPRAVEPLLEALNHDKSIEKTIVIHALGMLGDTRAVEPLKAYIHGKTAVVTIRALSQIGDVSSIIESLLSMLWTTEEYERIAAIEALEKSRDPRVIEDLVNIALHEDSQNNVSNAAEKALIQIGDTRVVAPLVSELGKKRTTVKCLRKGQRILSQLLRASAPNLATEDLRALASLEDGTETVPESKFNSMTDSYDSYDETVSVEFSWIRQAAQKELLQRGL